MTKRPNKKRVKTKRPGKKRVNAAKGIKKTRAKKKDGSAKRAAKTKSGAENAAQKPVQSVGSSITWENCANIFADHLVASAHTYAGLQERLTKCVLDNFGDVVNNPQLSDPVPSEFTTNPNNLDVTCQHLRSNFQNDHTWGIDAQKFTVDGGALLDAVKKYDRDHAPQHRTATIAWLISLIYHYVLAARVAKAA